MDIQLNLQGLIRLLNQARTRSKNQEVSSLLDQALSLSIRDFKEREGPKTKLRGPDGRFTVKKKF